MRNDMGWPPPVTTRARQRAAERAEQIRLGFQSTAVLYARAVEEKDWQVLGYRSVAAWAAGEFGPDRFSAERRKEIVALLTAAGHTQRKIAAAARTSPATVMRDQREQASVSSETQEVTEPVDVPQSPRQQAARNREAARRSPATDCPDPAFPLADELEDDDSLVDGPPLRPGRGSLRGQITGHLDDEPPAPPPTAPQRQLSDAQIEEIIAEDLGRGQIVTRYGVGEHAAQLARTAAVAIMGERRRVRTMVNELHKEAEVYLEQRRGTVAPDTLATDRVKIRQFLDWLAERAAS